MSACGTAETCVEKSVGGVFCLPDPLVSADQVVKVALFSVDLRDFSCASCGAPACEVTRDGGFISLQVVGQVCQPPSTVCPGRCKIVDVVCTLAALPIGQYQVGSPGQPSRSLKVVADGGVITTCAL